MRVAEFLRAGRSAEAQTVEFLAVVSDRASEDAVKSLIQDQAMPGAHAQMGTLDDVIRLLVNAERAPRQLLVDVSGSSMPLSDLARLAEVCDPSVNVIVIGDRNDVGLYRSLLEVGVQDYLVKPLTIDLLQRTLAANDPARQARIGKTIGFIGARGGVGVTSIATSLARYLSDPLQRRVAYVDLNLHGGAGNSMLGLTSNNGLTDLMQNSARTDAPSLERALVAKSNRLHVLSAELAYDADFIVHPGALAEVIGTLQRHFHYVILDVAGRSGPMVDDALNASNLIYVVADRSVYAARECARLIRFSESRASEPTVSLLLNNPLEPVPDRVHVADFKRALGRAAVHELPYDPKTLARAENLAEPVDGRKRGGFAEAIERIAHDVTGREAAAPAPWHQRLTWRLRRA